MRIALFSDCYIPTKNGVSTLLSQFKRAAESRNHHVTVVTPRVQGWHVNDETILRTTSMSLGQPSGQRGALIDQFDINKEIRRRQIEIIHTHTEFMLGISGRRAAATLDIPMLHTMHTMWEDHRHYFLPNGTPLSRQIVRWYLRHYLQPFRTIVVPSLKAKSYVSGLMPWKEPHIIPNAIDSSPLNSLDAVARMERRRAIRTKFSIADDSPLLLFVGRIGKEKRIDALLYSIGPLFKQRPNMQMLIVGDGPTFSSLQALVRRQKLTNQIRLVGFVEWERIFDYYLASDIFVTASLSEVHSMTLIEAISSGLPVAARRDAGSSNQVIHALNGYLADSDRELRGYLAQLVDDHALRRRFSLGSLRYATEYSIARNVDRTLELYSRLITSPRPSRHFRIQLPDLRTLPLFARSSLGMRIARK